MSIYLRVLLIVAALCASIYAIRKIRKSQMKIEDAMYWFLMTGLILLLSICPQIAYLLSRWIGVESPSNLIYLVMIFLLFVKVFSLSVRNAMLSHKLNTMAQEFAIWRKELEDNTR